MQVPHNVINYGVSHKLRKEANLPEPVQIFREVILSQALCGMLMSGGDVQHTELTLGSYQ